MIVFLEPIALYMTRDLHEEGDGAVDRDLCRARRGEADPARRGRPPRRRHRPRHRHLRQRLLSLPPGREDPRRRAHGLNAAGDRPALAGAARRGRRSSTAVAGCERVLIVDECRRTGSQSEALMALFAERAPDTPTARRITAEDSFIPLGRAATLTLPSRDSIVAAALELVAWLSKQAALVICPGRGTYGKAELGYLKRLHADKAELIATVDRLRAERGQPTISELDGAERFSPAPAHPRRHRLAADLHRLLCRFPRHRPVALRHRRGHRQFDGLVHDARLRRRGRALEHGFSIVDAMGENSQAGEPGGQVLLTLVDEDWREVPGLRDAAAGAGRGDRRPRGCDLYVSIELGGMMVFAGNEAGLAALLAEAPPTPGARAAAPGQSRPLPQPADAGLVGARAGAASRRLVRRARRADGRRARPDLAALRQQCRGAAALHLRHPDPRNLRFHPRRPGRGEANMRPTGSSCSAPATRSAARSPRR